ncbi:hypothetical protein VTN96DRAFT_6395 [Rasamsonia emersonii]
MDSFAPAPDQFPDEKDSFWTTFTNNDDWICEGLDVSALIPTLQTPVSPPIDGPSLNIPEREIDLPLLSSETTVPDTPVHAKMELSLAQLNEKVQNLEEAVKKLSSELSKMEGRESETRSG